jgi:acyl carrier protein
MGLQLVQLVMAVEESFDIEIPDAEAEKLITVGSLHAFVLSELNRVGRPAMDPADVYSDLRKLICEHLGAKPETVLPDAQFVRDLGAG